MFLDQEELRELTGREKPSAQARALNFMGIEHKRRPDGSIVVLREHVAAVMGVSHTEPDKGFELDMSTIR